MQIIPSLPLALALALPFLISFLVLQALIFKPFMAYLEERKATSENARKEASELSAEVETRLGELKDRLTQARSEGAGVRAEARTSAAKREGEILQAARSEAEGKLATAIESITIEKQNASVKLRETTHILSRDIASQVLGRQIQA